MGLLVAVEQLTNFGAILLISTTPAVHRCCCLSAGTPLQNDLSELQNLLHFLLPSVFAAQGFEDLAEMLQVCDGRKLPAADLRAPAKHLCAPIVPCQLV
jgi:hypothetical protein